VRGAWSGAGDAAGDGGKGTARQPDERAVGEAGGRRMSGHAASRLRRISI
jgi:hypothetical protein